MPRNTEGNVYLCHWEKQRRRFAVWLKDRPTIRCEGRDFRSALELLQGEVCEHFGDGEAVFDFDPPLPPDENTKRFLHPRIVGVTGNKGAVLDGDEADYFDRGTCSGCGTGLGKRTAKPLRLDTDSFSTATDGGFLRLKPMIRFYSDRFRSLLSRAEQSRFEWISLEITGRARRKFFELRCQSPVPRVPARGLDFHASVCETCLTQCAWILFQSGIQLHDFVCRDELPESLSNCFGVGEGLDVELCFSAEAWRKFAGKPGTHGLHANDIGVVNPADLDLSPAVYASKDYGKLHDEYYPLWGELRDQWMETAEVKAHVAAGGDAIDFISAKVRHLLFFRELNKRLKLPEWRHQ
jgi:hypothetical protein